MAEADQDRQGLSASSGNRSVHQDCSEVMVSLLSVLQKRREDSDGQDHIQYAECERSPFLLAFQGFVVFLLVICLLIGLGVNGIDLTLPGFTLDQIWAWLDLALTISLLLIPIVIVYNRCVISHYDLAVLDYFHLQTDHAKQNVSSQADPPSFAELNSAWPIRIALFLNSLVLVASLYGSIVLLPFLLSIIIAALFILGVLMLLPYFTLFVSVCQMSWLLGHAKRLRVGPELIWAGVVIGLVIFGGNAKRFYERERVIKMAVSSYTGEQRTGIRLVKEMGLEEEILCRCYYGESLELVDFWSGTDYSESDRKEFQDLYYRLTGCDYRSVPKPKKVGYHEFDEYSHEDIDD